MKARGFTLIELLVAMGIFGLIVAAATWILVSSIRNNAIIWEQLATQNDGRRVLQEVVDDVRRAETSSIGSYAIETADEYEFTFFANIDEDTGRERVRFWLDNEELHKGVIHPSGEPLSYDPGGETDVIIARDVKNIAQTIPLFEYYDESYMGTSTPLTQPVAVTDVHVVRVQLELEEDPTQTPVPLHVETTVHIRSLKTN